MQQQYGIGREIERQLATKGDSKRHVATPWDWRDSQRHKATILECKRHAATPWDQDTVRDIQQI